jgi:ABC-type Fe3+-siderophore transport system permease subunit
MSTTTIRNDFIIRVLIATTLMGAGAWYLGSLWNARMRDLNLILIEPVVFLMIPFYLGALHFEYRRYRKQLAAAQGPGPVQVVVDEGEMMPNATRNQVRFLAMAAISVAAFYIFGALIATVFMIVGGMMILGVRRPVPLIVTPIVTTFFLWLVFIELFDIHMPLYPTFL